MTLGTERIKGMTTVRLWDQDMRRLATAEGCPEPDQRPGALDFAVTVRGTGALHTALCNLMRNGSLLDGPTHLTVDGMKFDGRRRLGGIVTKIEVQNRPCECGENNVVVTTVHAAPVLPRNLAVEWPVP